MDLVPAVLGVGDPGADDLDAREPSAGTATRERSYGITSTIRLPPTLSLPSSRSLS
jgi:hypothetical protein